jgi:6-phosphogluconate dehydrogenase
MVLRVLERSNVEVVAYNRSTPPIEAAARAGARSAFTLEQLVRALRPPRIIWLMVPAGPSVDEVLIQLMALASPGDIFVDGGNSFYQDSERRAQEAEARGFFYLDVGTSGGIWGRTIGYSLMIGGPPEAYAKVEPVFKALAPDGGYGLVGPSGAGHFAKMVHNGIEYGMMEAYAEGFEILERSPFRYNLSQLAGIWNHGSVIRSWLLELAERALVADPKLEAVSGYVEDTGEGRWTVKTAIDEDVPAPSITAALMARFYSRDQNSFSARLLAALRQQFGGHAARNPTDRKSA